MITNQTPDQSDPIAERLAKIKARIDQRTRNKPKRPLRSSQARRWRNTVSNDEGEEN